MEKINGNYMPYYNVWYQNQFLLRVKANKKVFKNKNNIYTCKKKNSNANVFKLK